MPKTPYHWICLGIVATLLPCSGELASGNAPPDLPKLIAEALSENPGLHVLQARIAATEAGQREARAMYYPQLGAGAGYTITDNAPQAFMLELNQRTLNMADPAFDPNNPDDTGNLQLALHARYPLFQPSRSAQNQIAHLARAQSEKQLAAARNALVHAVTQGFYQVLEAQAFVAVQESALDSFSESLRVARERHASGAAVRTDVLNLEVQLAQANENLIRARNGQQLAIAVLNTTIGRDTVSTNGLLYRESQLSPPQAMLTNLTLRPEYTIAENALKMSEEQTRVAKAGKLPGLTAYGSVIWDGESIDDQEQSYIAGLMLEWNWFDGGLSQSRIASARAMEQAAAANLQQTELALTLEQKQAFLQLEEAWQRIQVTERSVASAEEALRITRALYQEGSTEIATLLVAEVALIETRMRATAARYDYHIALSNSKRTAGLLGQNGTQGE